MTSNPGEGREAGRYVNPGSPLRPARGIRLSQRAREGPEVLRHEPAAGLAECLGYDATYLVSCFVVCYPYK